MSKSTSFSNKFLKLIFNGDAIPNLADNAATSPATNLYLSLHTASPGGTQSTNECAYTGYGRVAVARSASGFVVTDNSVSPASVVSFGECSSGTEVATYAAVGAAASGNNYTLYYGLINPSIAISIGITPQLSTGTEITEE